jgi:Ca2+-binding RTX toxin-like protein
LGLGGIDRLYGGLGADRMEGGNGNDVIFDNKPYADRFSPVVDSSIDRLFGGAGNDVLAGGNFDRYDGGSGQDTLRMIVVTDRGFDFSFLRLSTQPGVKIKMPGGGTAVNVESIEMLATQFRDRVRGTDNHDHIQGYDGDDELSGNGGSDDLFGEEGADTLNGGAGADNLIGGIGNDIYVIDADDVVYEFGNEGTDEVRSAFSAALGSNVENLSLTGNFDIHGTGNDGKNKIVGNGGNNTLYGLGGDDELIGGGGNDTLHGGAQSDALDGGVGADALYGGDGGDSYRIDNTGDQIIEDPLDAGIDRAYSIVDYTMPSSVEELVLLNNAIAGTGNIENNFIVGNDNANMLYGLGGDDILEGAFGVDVMVGGAGNDVYYAGDYGDQVIELASDAGIDTVYSFAFFTLGDGVENLVLRAGQAGVGNELGNRITSLALDATLIGLGGNDVLIGANGTTNALDGGEGNDTLSGGTGRDRLLGGEGQDALAGGADADTFVFGYLSAIDTVTDFNVSDDTLALDGAAFSLVAGALSAAAFRVGSSAGDASDRIIYNSATGALFFDADGSDGGEQVQFAGLTAGLALTAADFTVI